MKITSRTNADIRADSILDFPFTKNKVASLIAPGASSCCSFGSCSSSSCGAVSAKK